jgi:hypothetical protein
MTVPARRVLVAVIGVGLALTPAAAAQSRRASGRRASAPKQFFDARDAQRLAVASRGATSLHPATRRADAARTRLRAQGARVEIDRLTGTPRVLAGAPALSGPADDDPLEIAARFLREHLAALGLDREDLGSLTLVGRTPIPGGAVQVAYRQFANGIPSFDGGIRVTVDRAGRVLQVTGAPQPDLSLPTTVPAVSASDALRRVMRDVGVGRPVRVTSGPRGVRRVTGFRADAAAAALTTFADGDRARLAWQVDYRAAPLAHYHALVDAATGAILYRANSVKTAANDASVWEEYPGATNGGTQQTRDLTPYLSSGATDLSGPYAHAWSDVNDNDSSTTDSNGHIVPLDTPDVGEAVARSAGGNFVFPFTDFTASNTLGACDTAHKCSWNFDTKTSWQTNRAQNAVQAFWYVNRWRDHLVAAPISFSGADGNFEGSDRVLVNTDDGAATGPGGGPDADHVDNAYMDTPPDGTSPTMAMFLFFNGGDFRDANGGDDADVVYHEYTHGLSGRLVTDAGGEEALNSGQAAAMGEGWSDFYAEDFLVDEFPSNDSPTAGEVDMGRYLDSQPHTLRTQGLDCPVGAAAAQCPGTPAQGSGGYTYGDYNAVDKEGTPPQAEPHQAGEIWGETLWDLRGVLGSSVTEAIVTQGMRLSPTEPTFLEERDAILAADHQLFPGADHSAQIWEVFANRGMGTNASSPTKDTVVEGFDRPPPSGSPPGGQPPPPSGSTHPAAPVLKLPRSGSRGRVRLTVTCDSPCSGSARLTASHRTAKHLHLRGRTVGSSRIKRTAAGKSTVTVKLTARTLRALRRGHATSLKATLTVTITDGELQRTAAHRQVRIRRR